MQAHDLDDGGRLFGVYSADETVAKLPYLRGGQGGVQWADVQTAPSFTFGPDGGGTPGLLPVSRNPRCTIQINGNIHPTFLFEHVPYIPSDNSWSAENHDPCPESTRPLPAGTKSCVLQYWHPYFVEQYTAMIRALADHLARVSYSSDILGVRQNFDAVGTEGTGIPSNLRHSSLWTVPPGVVPATAFDASGHNSTALWYTRTIFAQHANAFVGGKVLLLARNNLDIAIRTSKIQGRAKNFGARTYGELMKNGLVGWFHTSSEVEPRLYGHGATSGDWGQYQTFKSDCSNTICYAEPWADAWGFHGKKDLRWCSPPQWNYWRLLSDLHMGVGNIALYGSDAAVAADATHMGEVVSSQYQREFNDAFEFAAKYVGYQSNASQSPGAWIAFRESVSDLGSYNNVTDYQFLLSLTNPAQATIGME